MARSNNKPKSLSSGRPGNATKGTARLSSRLGRSIIRSHHTLNKALEIAESTGNVVEAAKIRAQLEAQGGISSYQRASLLGQSVDRGGDSSQVLVKWLKTRVTDKQQSLRVLEIGALSTLNACSKWELMKVTRIDINAQAEGILQQDFMERPLPTSEHDKFEVISLSLVLNFVPSTRGRGEMLKRTCKFLAIGTDPVEFWPYLFMVLPVPCLVNSRYMTAERFSDIMTSIGYLLLESKSTAKLVYQLWQYRRDVPTKTTQSFAKIELNPGKGRNNFSVVL